ncbi:OVARIAN TUMOR DOMAIN-containing deubiquitinating enzyme 12 isoform X2 [Quercus lobata]|uniref:OVARIAN TUMOR DOMAIN-containing deubiquitinating enzyme 12 isoform X2 n=1 Tax=Quercus lobata TaxID=97700 RepID=UPI001246D003|nr:OVARIAN TUMOR DOMAIN-containing deubiquitinating enzyme 12 isoform X2 [Quercus lobata]
MATYDYDPDVTRWGLHHLLDVCTLRNNASCCGVTRYDQDLSQVEFVREGYCEKDNVENDEAVARALQEEFMRIDCLEASGVSNGGPEHLQESVLAQNWLGPSGRHYSYGHDNDQQAANEPGIQMENAVPCGIIIEEASDHNRVENDVHPEIKMFTSCSSPGGGEPSYVDDLLHIFDIADESSLDGEVGKRLNQMVPVPHVPKTIEKIPTVDEEISDHQRLLERLELYELVELKVQGDGNCQMIGWGGFLCRIQLVSKSHADILDFRALSDQLYRSPDHHASVREQITQQLKCHPEMYGGYVPMAYNDYLKKMSKSGEWGDHVTLQAAADWFGVKIFVLTSFKDTCYIEILPHIEKSKRVIFLSFWAEVHYNSIYPKGDLPEVDTKKKRKWWNFGNLISS